MASYVAKDLVTWRRWELSDQLQKILSTIDSADPLTKYAIKLYLAKAESADKSW